MKIRNAACYSFSLDAQEPMAYLRLIAPFRELGIDIIKGIDEYGQSVVNVVSDGDIVILQREFPAKYSDYRSIVALARQEGKPIVFELDDLLFYMPDTHPDRNRQYYSPTLLPMLHAIIEADIVTVTTEKLRDVLVEYNPNVVVVQNFFDENLWGMRPPVQKDPSFDKLTIGYMGTNSHQPDLDYIAPVLLNIIRRYPEKINLHFWGAQPPAELEILPQVEWISQYFSSYAEFAEFFQTQSADIFISPLCDNPFNKCKSAIKFFEYSALGSPGIYSRLEPYLAVVDHKENGLLASSLDEWGECLTQLIEDDALRFQLATNAQASIREKWLLSQNAYRWEGVIDKAVEIASGKQQSKTYSSILDSINSQLYDVYTAMRNQLDEQEKNIRTMTTELNDARDDIEQLNGEIMNYVLSKSWRMTRPLRKIGKKLDRFSG